MGSVFNDPFTYMVEEVDSAGKAVDVLAGADNIYAATAAFDAMKERRPTRRLILRQKGRIIQDTADGKPG